MHHKNIKALIKKQLKNEYPNWKWLPKKQKRQIAQKVLDEVVRDYDFNTSIDTPECELFGIENQYPIPSGIMDLDTMDQFVENHRNLKIFKIDRRLSSPVVEDEELKFIHELLDNEIINKLLSYGGYRAASRTFTPSHFLRAELLKTIKYPEISYRKFCGDDKHYKGYKKNNDYTGMGEKQNRAFIGLPLHKQVMLSHIQMSQFRNSLTFAQQINLLVYIIHHFRKSGYLEPNAIHCVDSTELASECQKHLASVKIKGKKIRIYNDIDCDCGKRRNKRDKSPYVVGYRMHTLTAINPETGHSYPLVSLLAPANHHDSNYLQFLAELGQAMGIDVKLITADEAYNDKTGSLVKDTGIHLVKPPNAKVGIPENVTAETMQVTMDDLCETPMQYMGTTDQGHEFKCGAETGQCLRDCNCPQYREIPFDEGRFQRIIYGSKEMLKALDIRKNGERPFNLLKKREGLDHVRVRSQSAVIVRCTFTTIATLLLEMAGTRHKEKYDVCNRQLKLPQAVGF